MGLKLIRVSVLLQALHPHVLPQLPLSLTGLTKKVAKLVWDNDCEQAFQLLKNTLVQLPSWHTLCVMDRSFSPCIRVTLNGMAGGVALEQQQEEDGRVVKRVIVYTSKTIC